MHHWLFWEAKQEQEEHAARKLPGGCHDWLPDPGDNNVVTPDDDTSGSSSSRRLKEAERRVELGELKVVKLAENEYKEYQVFEEVHTARRLCRWIATSNCRSLPCFGTIGERHHGRTFGWAHFYGIYVRNQANHSRLIEHQATRDQTRVAWNVR